MNRTWEETCMANYAWCWDVELNDDSIRIYHQMEKYIDSEKTIKNPYFNHLIIKYVNELEKKHVWFMANYAWCSDIELNDDNIRIYHHMEKYIDFEKTIKIPYFLFFLSFSLCTTFPHRFHSLTWKQRQPWKADCLVSIMKPSQKLLLVTDLSFHFFYALCQPTLSGSESSISRLLYKPDSTTSPLLFFKKFFVCEIF